jgi:hypothetical protein
MFRPMILYNLPLAYRQSNTIEPGVLLRPEPSMIVCVFSRLAKKGLSFVMMDGVQGITNRKDHLRLHTIHYNNSSAGP